ncbi:MAG: hypothetical protein LBC20_07975, partial [Planctomycetaceae bacterium]|nr:hypothetical protein [Planctomycetaceae bacterium]
MVEETRNGNGYEYNEVWHPGRGSYYYYGYLYSGTAPGSHIPSGSAPSSPSAYGSITVAGIPLNYNGNPNFTNYAFVDPEAILDEKYPKPPEPVTPNPTESPVIISGVGAPLANESAWWAGTKAFLGSLKTTAYDLGNHLTFGKILDSERYNDQVNAQGERLYNVAKNLGWSDKSITKGYGLAQALAGEAVGTNALAEAGTGYDLGRNIILDGEERIEKAASGVAQVA